MHAHSEKTGEQLVEDKVGVLLMVNGCVVACVYMYIHLLQVVVVMWQEETLMPCIQWCDVKLYFSSILMFVLGF